MRRLRIGNRVLEKTANEEDLVEKIKRSSESIIFDSKKLDKVPDNTPTDRIYSSEEGLAEASGFHNGFNNSRITGSDDVRTVTIGTTDSVTSFVGSDSISSYINDRGYNYYTVRSFNPYSEDTIRRFIQDELSKKED